MKRLVQAPELRRKLGPRRFLAAVLVALSGWCAIATGGASSSARGATPAGQAQPVTPLAGLCDAAGVLDVVGDLSDTDRAKKQNQIALLQGRIIDCSHKLADVLAQSSAPTPLPYWNPAPTVVSTPAPACVHPPPATTLSNRLALYEMLTRCARDLAALSAPPSPAPAASPLPSIASRPTFYVFATGAVDPATATVLIRSVVGRLTRARQRVQAAASSPLGSSRLADLVIAGRADWTTSDAFAAQCQGDSNTRGALIIESSVPESYRFNYFLLIANFQTVSAAVDVLACGPEDHTPAASPLSLLREEGLSGKAHQDALTLGIFTSIATLLAVGNTKTTLTTGGGQTTVTKSDATAPVFTGNVLGYFENQNLNLPAQNASITLAVAADRFADQLASRLRVLCRQPDLVQLAAASNPLNVPLPAAQFRTTVYRAAYEYERDCTNFADFDARP